MPTNVQLVGVYFGNLVDEFTSDSKGCWNTKIKCFFFCTCDIITHRY